MENTTKTPAELAESIEFMSGVESIEFCREMLNLEIKADATDRQLAVLVEWVAETALDLENAEIDINSVYRYAVKIRDGKKNDRGLMETTNKTKIYSLDEEPTFLDYLDKKHEAVDILGYMYSAGALLRQVNPSAFGREMAKFFDSLHKGGWLIIHNGYYFKPEDLELYNADPANYELVYRGANLPPWA